MARSLMGNSWQPWSSSKHLSLGADQGIKTATSMVGTICVVGECPPLKLPLRFGRCSSVQQGAPEICYDDRTSLSGADNAGSRGAPPTPLPDSATVRVSSAVMGPVIKAFEPMQFEFNGRKVALIRRSGQEEVDKRLLHGPFTVEDDRSDPMLEEASGNLLGPVLGCPNVVSPAGEESQAACRSGPLSPVEETVALEPVRFSLSPRNLGGLPTCSGIFTAKTALQATPARIHHSAQQEASSEVAASRFEPYRPGAERDDAEVGAHLGHPPSGCFVISTVHGYLHLHTHCLTV